MVESDQSADDNEQHEAMEVHRSFVREMNGAFGTVYGYGGAVVLALTVATPLVGWQFGALKSPLLWLATVLVFLGSLFALRLVVRRRAERLVGRVRQYCEVNDVSADALRDHYADEETYPYFNSMFEVVERRRQRAGE